MHGIGYFDHLRPCANSQLYVGSHGAVAHMYHHKSWSTLCRHCVNSHTIRYDNGMQLVYNVLLILVHALIRNYIVFDIVMCMMTIHFHQCAYSHIV